MSAFLTFHHVEVISEIDIVHSDAQGYIVNVDSFGVSTASAFWAFAQADIHRLKNSLQKTVITNNFFTAFNVIHGMPLLSICP